MTSDPTDSESGSYHNREETSRGRLASRLKATANKWLPEGIAKEVQRYRSFTNAERPIYLRKRVLNSIGFDRPVILKSPEKIRSVVFVCFGNIIRSPMCEALLIRKLADVPTCRIAVNSAGLNALSGRLAHPWALAAAKEFGVSLDGHRAGLLTGEMVHQADAIFAMDHQNQVQLLTRWPEAENRVYMLGAYGSADYSSVEIPDPYYLSQSETGVCYRRLSDCIDRLAAQFSTGSRRQSVP